MPNVVLFLSDVDPNSLADESRLAPGMVILEVNKKQVNSIDQFSHAVKNAKNVLRFLVRYQDSTWYVAIKL